jgi:hypothetical protein
MKQEEAKQEHQEASSVKQELIRHKTKGFDYISFGFTNSPKEGNKAVSDSRAAF